MQWYHVVALQRPGLHRAQGRHRGRVVVGEQVRVDTKRRRHLAVPGEPRDLKRRYARRDAQAYIRMPQRVEHHRGWQGYVRA